MALRRLIDDKGCAVLDGGFATTLETTGYKLDNKLWSGYAPVDNPAGVTEVHKQFIAAGADIVTTCSYQMSYEGNVLAVALHKYDYAIASNISSYN